MAMASSRTRRRDTELRDRATKVIPGGMYGHQNVTNLPESYPQFMRSGKGALVVDVDGNEYVDLMCSYGPVILGHRHAIVEEAARRQLDLADCQNGPGEVMVELAELLTATVRHAEWAMFEKNGTDATTLCCTIARAGTGGRTILAAKGAYHGAAPWCTPNPAGTTTADRANTAYYTYNDIASLEAAFAEHRESLAGVIVTPFRHDAGYDQELVDPAFARRLRELCDQHDVALILDDVRCGFRLHHGSSWEPLGVDPDLSAWSKAIANGYPLAAVLGNDRYREAAHSLFTTGSFWFSAASMAAAVATIGLLGEIDAVGAMVRSGTALRNGLAQQAARHGIAVLQSGPVQMPFLSFAGDTEFQRARVFASTSMEHGVYLHPVHNWFISAALDDDLIDRVLEATDVAFAAVKATL